MKTIAHRTLNGLYCLDNRCPDQEKCNTCFAKTLYLTLFQEENRHATSRVWKKNWQQFCLISFFGQSNCIQYIDRFLIDHEPIIIIINFTIKASIEARNTFSLHYRNFNQQFLITFIAAGSRWITKIMHQKYVDRNDCDHFSTVSFRKVDIVLTE